MGPKKIGEGGRVPPVESVTPGQRLPQDLPRKTPPERRPGDTMSSALDADKEKLWFQVKKNAGIYDRHARVEEEWVSLTQEEAEGMGLNWDDGKDERPTE